MEDIADEQIRLMLEQHTSDMCGFFSDFDRWFSERDGADGPIATLEPRRPYAPTATTRATALHRGRASSITGTSCGSGIDRRTRSLLKRGFSVRLLSTSTTP